MSNSGRGHLGLPAALLLLAAVLVAGLTVVLLAPAGSPAAPWWPAAGIAVTLLGLAPRRWWWWLVPAIAVTTAAANISGGRAVDLSCWYAVGNATEALVVAALLRRGRETLPELADLDTFLRLMVAAVVGGATFATIASSGVVILTDSPFVTAWRALSVSHAASTLLILPLAMAPAMRRPGRWTGEFLVQLLALTAVTLAIFGPGQTVSLDFLPLPLLMWAALRFDVRIVAGELIGFAVVTVLLNARGSGPFGFDMHRGALTAFGLGAVVQAYILTSLVMALALAIGLEQHRRLLDRTASSERLFRRNFTESVVGMLLLRSTDEDLLEITEMNDAAARLLGDGGTTVGHGLGEVLSTSEPLDLVVARMLSGTLEGWKTESGLRARPGARVEVLVSLLSREPEPTFAAQLLDVTAQYDARRRIEAAEKLTSATLDTTPALIIVCDLYGEVVRVNGATTVLTGFAEEELVGKEVWDLPFASPGSTGYPTGLPTDAFAQVSRETDVITSTGARRRVLWNTGYVRDERDRPTYIVMTGTDLTAERTAAGLNRHLLEAAITTALIGIDPRGRITVFNAGAVNLLGYDAQDMVGTRFVDLLDPAQLADRFPGATRDEAFDRLVAGDDADATVPRDWTWISRDGRPHTISMTVTVAADTVAARLGYLCVGRDVTEARASQDMLVAALDKERLAVERMRQLDEAKNEFISTVSHELRTPVTSIVGYTEILEDGSVVDPAPEQRPLLDSIARNAQRLIALCNDLLTLGGLDSGATHWARETIDLATILTEAEDAVRPMAAGRDITVSFSSAPGPVLVLGDRVQLERVVVNLVGNAIKFTEDGGSVECRVERDGAEACLVVSDTGIGIPDDEQPQLFQRFFRSSTAQQMAIQGTGLGLSIVAAIVAAHGGRIDVRSAHREGTTFTVRLPLARVRRG
ncbi:MULTISPECIES: ATP-binding protein [unclassified Nocardioides]|uniref:ATP-binding protein n=1 Tax=unclassified Nocardioides TaxID=2615069 RepID=UPI000A2697E4|nr:MULTISPECIES: ATP-binding protein [unclassified Nocardioides]